MNLLLVTETYPPMLEPGALSAGKLVQALLEAGHRVTVLAADDEGRGPDPVDTSTCWRDVQQCAVRVRVPRGMAARFAAATAGRLWGRLPGGGAWIYEAYRTARALAKLQGFDAILTGYVPFRTALIGRGLKREFGIPWLAQFPDPSPWCLYPPPYGPGRPVTIRDRYVVRRTRALLRDADALITPSAQLAAYVDDAYGYVFRGRHIVLPHIGWSRPGGERRRTAFVHLLHPGIRMHGRESDEIVQTLRTALTEARSRGIAVRLTFSGYVSGRKTLPEKMRDLEEYIEWQPAAAYEDSLAQMHAASGLLLVEAVMSQGIFLPSKVGDYAASGLPVLMFSPLHGTIADLVGGVRHPGFLTQDPPVAARRLATFFEKAASGARLDEYRFPDPFRYQPDRVVEALLAGIERWSNVPTGTAAPPAEAVTSPVGE